jgi:hypothetical protein
VRRSERTHRGERGSKLRVVKTRIIFGINRNLQAAVQRRRLIRRMRHSSLPGLTRQSIYFEKVFAKTDGPAGRKRVYARLRRASARG